jgi:hypothetical protein
MLLRFSQSGNLKAQSTIPDIGDARQPFTT